MNNLEDDNYINRMYDEFNNARNTLMLELKNDRECNKEKVINQKIQCVDNLMKNILKYRNIKTKDKMNGGF